MSFFKCDQCEYETSKKTNYNRHISSKKHKENVSIPSILPNLYQNFTADLLEESNDKPFLCGYCDNKYSTKNNLLKHTKSCIMIMKRENEHKQKIMEYQNRIAHLTEMLEKEINNKDEIIKGKDDMISTLKTENRNLRVLLNNAGSVVKTSVSTMSYIIKNYNEAPVLESFTDIAALHYDATPQEFVERILYEYRHDNLTTYIGDLILKDCKKEDPTKQSIWNSDTARLTYIIRELFNKSADWRVDKRGIKTTQFIITPVLEYIIEKLEDYIEKSKIGKRSQTTKDVVDIMMNLKHAREVIQLIEDKVLEDDILKYMAPHLYIVKNTDMLIED